MNGLDPEYLITDSDGMIVPAEMLIPPDFNPETIPHGYGSMRITPATLSPDNAAVEIRPAASSCLQTLYGNTQALLNVAEKFHRLARLRGDIPHSNLSITPAASLRDEHRYLETVSQFGCAPSLLLTSDLNVIEQSPEVDPTETPYRSAGFHVHYSNFDGSPPPSSRDHHITSLIPVIAFLDALIGLVDVMMNDAAGLLDASRIRRETLGYGLGGEFRIVSRRAKHFEYRTLSPWPLSHPIWTWWAGSAVRSVFRKASMEILPRLPDRSEILDVIKTGTAEDAMPLWLKSVRVWLDINEDRNQSLSRRNLGKLYHALLNGGHSYYTAGDHPYKAWRFGKTTGPRAGVASKIEQRRDYHNMAMPIPDYLDPRHYTRPRSHGSYLFFPSGTDTMLEYEYNSPTLPSLPKA